MPALKNSKEEFKIAYKLAVEMNSIKSNVLQKLHKKNKNIIDKWLYVDNRFPDFQACFELERFIRALRGKMPRELARIISRSKERVNGLIDTIEVNPLSDFEIVGTRKQVGRRAAITFIVDGESTTIGQIIGKTRLSREKIRYLLYKNNLYKDGSDITFFYHKYLNIQE